MAGAGAVDAACDGFHPDAVVSTGFCGALDPALTVAAVVVGVLCGMVASVTFRALSRTAVSSSAEPSELVGQLGRVLLDMTPGRRGKIRLQVRGQTIDLLAVADKDALAEGAPVLVVGLRDSVALVRPAPPELSDKTE